MNPVKGVWVSKLTGLEAEVFSIRKDGIGVKVQRRTVDKRTGEVKIDVNERDIKPGRNWRLFAQSYEPPTT